MVRSHSITQSSDIVGLLRQRGLLIRADVDLSRIVFPESFPKYFPGPLGLFDVKMATSCVSDAINDFKQVEGDVWPVDASLLVDFIE